MEKQETARVIGIMNHILKTESYEQQAKKYLSPLVQNFKPATNTVMTYLTVENHEEVFQSLMSHGMLTEPKKVEPVYRTNVISSCYFQVRVKGEVREEHIERFCKMINQLAEDNVLEQYVLAPVFGLKLESGMTLLCFFGFSRLPLKILKQLNPLYFAQEGELLNPESVWE